MSAAAICSPEVVEKLVDAAFRELQHDTGPLDQEYRHQRRVLTNEFARILCVRKGRALSPSAEAPQK